MSVSKKKFIVTILVALAEIGLVCVFHDNIVLVTGGIALLALVLLWQQGFSKVAVYSFVTFAVSGFLAEASAVACGVWSYASPQTLGLPIWLPLVWGLVGVAGTQLTEILQKRYGKK